MFLQILAMLNRIENMGKDRRRRKINNGVHPRQTDAEMPWDNEDDK